MQSDIFRMIGEQSFACIILIFAIFCFFYYMASLRQKRVEKLHENTFKAYERMNAQLGTLISETRKSNRLLSEFVELEPFSEEEAEAELSNELEVSQPTEALAPSNKLYIGNVDYAATEQELSDLFHQFGEIEMVNIPVERYSGRARGFGFVTFVAQEAAEQAVVLHGSEFKGRQIQVKFAKERSA